MDDTALLLSSKNQKPSEEQTSGEGIDIISCLSDHVLHHVLSFLSTKDSIRTSILSRRWKYLWTSISNIDLDDMSSGAGKKKDRSFFLDFVDRVLHLHDASDIKRLRLMFSVQVNSFRLSSWISGVITRHNVQELDLSLPVRTRFVLPCCLFTCESLVTLKLEMDCVLKPPSFIHFSNLKTLELYLLKFSDETSAQQLFSCCPKLQELSLMNCGWKNITTITISIPTLKRLTIEDDIMWEDVLSCVVKIYAANLIYLNFTSNLKVDFQLCDLSSLVNAFIDLQHSYLLHHSVAPRAIRVLNGICNVQFLTLSDDSLQYLRYVENLMNHLPTFHNMTHLELNSGFHGYLSGVMIDLLKKSPKLEFLDFAEGFNPDTVHDHEVHWMLERVLKTSLKTFSISYFGGKPAEMHFLRFLLKNATNLEKMLVFCESNLVADTEMEEEINNQLNMFPRGSESCVIELL